MVLRAAPPDRFELSIRAGCGALFGAIVGFASAVGYLEDDLPYFLLLVFTSVTTCAWGAVKYGDHYWYGDGRGGGPGTGLG